MFRVLRTAALVLCVLGLLVFAGVGRWRDGAGQQDG
mgnify:CR=1 FL=1